MLKLGELSFEQVARAMSATVGAVIGASLGRSKLWPLAMLSLPRIRPWPKKAGTREAPHVQEAALTSIVRTPVVPR